MQFTSQPEIDYIAHIVRAVITETKRPEPRYEEPVYNISPRVTNQTTRNHGYYDNPNLNGLISHMRYQDTHRNDTDKELLDNLLQERLQKELLQKGLSNSNKNLFVNDTTNHAKTPPVHISLQRERIPKEEGEVPSDHKSNRPTIKKSQSNEEDFLPRKRDEQDSHTIRKSNSGYVSPGDRSSAKDKHQYTNSGDREREDVSRLRISNTSDADDKRKYERKVVFVDNDRVHSYKDYHRDREDEEKRYNGGFHRRGGYRGPHHKWRKGYGGGRGGYSRKRYSRWDQGYNNGDHIYNPYPRDNKGSNRLRSGTDRDKSDENRGDDIKEEPKQDPKNSKETENKDDRDPADTTNTETIQGQPKETTQTRDKWRSHRDDDDDDDDDLNFMDEDSTVDVDQ